MYCFAIALVSRKKTAIFSGAGSEKKIACESSEEVPQAERLAPRVERVPLSTQAWVESRTLLARGELLTTGAGGTRALALGVAEAILVTTEVLAVGAALSAGTLGANRHACRADTL